MSTASGGWESWSWDESLFAGAAAYYEQGRLPYAPDLAGVFARSLALDGRGRLLDAGCGPGTVTLRLAPLFEAAVGLDPDPEMLACASRAAAGRDIGNVTWVRQRAEALPAGLGSSRAVTFAASFHWMDRITAIGKHSLHGVREGRGHAITPAAGVHGDATGRRSPDRGCKAKHVHHDADAFGEGLRDQRAPLEADAVPPVQPRPARSGPLMSYS